MVPQLLVTCNSQEESKKPAVWSLKSCHSVANCFAMFKDYELTLLHSTVN